MRHEIAGHVRTRERASAREAEAARPCLASKARWGLGSVVISKAIGGLGSVVLALILLLVGPAAADPASRAPGGKLADVPASISPTGLRSLEALLSVPPVRDVRTAAERTDLFLAEAIARRGGERRVATTGFKKRSIDLFRAERPVEVGQQEMLLRLRLRAKSRETMSVELRY